MAWRSVGNDFEPDGVPFEHPADSFERAYNAYIEREGMAPESFGLSDGLPLSTRLMERRPLGEAETRRLLDWFFDIHTQELARSNGNTVEEMDKLARGVLLWAVYYNVPIRDNERNVAGRLRVDVGHLGRHDHSPASYRPLGL